LLCPRGLLFGLLGPLHLWDFYLFPLYSIWGTVPFFLTQREYYDSPEIAPPPRALKSIHSRATQIRFISLASPLPFLQACVCLVSKRDSFFPPPVLHLLQQMLLSFFKPSLALRHVSTLLTRSCFSTSPPPFPRFFGFSQQKHFS